MMASTAKQQSGGSQEPSLFLDILTKEEKESLLNKKMEEIRRKNEALRKRHEEIEADKKAAQQQGRLVDPRLQVSVTPNKKPDAPREIQRETHRNMKGVREEQKQGSGKLAAGRAKRLNNMSRETLKANTQVNIQIPPQGPEYEKGVGGGGAPPGGHSPDQPQPGPGRRRGGSGRLGSQTSEPRSPGDSENGPPPDPAFNFLSDRSREGPLPDKVREQKVTSRHPRNFGGSSFNNVQHKMQTEKELQSEHSFYQQGRQGGPPRSKMEMAMKMTGRERREYSEWKSERERIDQARIDRQLSHQGDWRREWDHNKVEQDFESDPSASGEQRTEPGRRPAGRIGSGRFDRGDSLEERKRGDGPGITVIGYAVDGQIVRLGDQIDEDTFRNDPDSLENTLESLADYERESRGARDQGRGGRAGRSGSRGRGMQRPTSGNYDRHRASSTGSDETSRSVEEQNDSLIVKIDNEFASTAQHRRFKTSPSEDKSKRRSFDESSHESGYNGNERDRERDRGGHQRGFSRERQENGEYQHGDRGDYPRGGDRGDYSRSGDRGNYQRGGDRGNYQRGSNRGNYQRGGDRDGYQRGSDRGDFQRGGDRDDYQRGGDRGDYQRGGGGDYQRGGAGLRRGTNRPERARRNIYRGGDDGVRSDGYREPPRGRSNATGRNRGRRAGSGRIPDDPNFHEGDSNLAEVEPHIAMGTFDENWDYGDFGDLQPGQVVQIVSADLTEKEISLEVLATAGEDEEGLKSLDDEEEWEDAHDFYDVKVGTAEDDEDDDDEPDPHNSSAESLERFIQEHTLKLDVNVESMVPPLSPLSDPASPDSGNMGKLHPLNAAKVMDWGASENFSDNKSSNAGSLDTSRNAEDMTDLPVEQANESLEAGEGEELEPGKDNTETIPQDKESMETPEKTPLPEPEQAAEQEKPKDSDIKVIDLEKEAEKAAEGKPTEVATSKESSGPGPGTTPDTYKAEKLSEPTAEIPNSPSADHASSPPSEVQEPPTETSQPEEAEPKESNHKEASAEETLLAEPKEEKDKKEVTTKSESLVATESVESTVTEKTELEEANKPADQKAVLTATVEAATGSTDAAANGPQENQTSKGEAELVASPGASSEDSSASKQG